MAPAGSTLRVGGAR